jgi:hypothetical protein
VREVLQGDEKRERAFVHRRERQITLSNVMQDITKSLMGHYKNPQ